MMTTVKPTKKCIKCGRQTSLFGNQTDLALCQCVTKGPKIHFYKGCGREGKTTRQPLSTTCKNCRRQLRLEDLE